MKNQVGSWEHQGMLQVFHYTSILGDVVANVAEWDAAFGNDMPSAALILDASEGRLRYGSGALV